MVKICTIASEWIKDIEDCLGCNEARRLGICYSGGQRRKRCELINDEAPDSSEGLKSILIGEAPTDGSRFFMNRGDPASGGGDGLATIVWTYLRNSGDRQLDGDIANIDERINPSGRAIAKKGLILDAMKRDGCGFLDCCQCITTKKKGSMRRKLLDRCFTNHTLGVLVDLCANHPDAVVVPCYQTCDEILEESGCFYEVPGKGRHRSWKMKCVQWTEKCSSCSFSKVDRIAKILAQRRLEVKVERVRKGDFKEFWLQVYIQHNYRDLGFSEITGPHERGYDFTGVLDGKKVVIEAERKPSWFLNHGHNKDEVDVLIVMADDETPRNLLPKKIMIVDAEDLVKKTHEARKDYAINVAPITQARREAEAKANRDPALYMLGGIVGALSSLHGVLFGDEFYEGTPEDDLMHEAATSVALRYISFYDLCRPLGKMEDVRIPEIEAIWHRVSKYGTEGLTEREWEHLTIWLSHLRNEYVKKI